MAQLLEEVMTALRITSQDQEIKLEIESLITSAKQDLLISGVTALEDDNPLIKRAIIFYAKAYFGFDNPDAERYEKCYRLLANHLALSLMENV